MPAARSRCVVLVALFVTLIPTTIGALLSAIGIAGMDRLVRFNVLAMSGRAVEAAGDVDTLLLDKTGTITLGNRQATRVHAAAAASPSSELADAAQLASLADETPEGRSIVVLAKEKYGIRGRDMARAARASSFPSRRRRRMSGVDVDGVVDPQGRGRRHSAVLARRCQSGAGARASSASAPNVCARSIDRRCDRQSGRHAAGGRQGRPAARRHPPQGHRQGRHPRALRRAAPHGHPHRHDHRRQPADRRGDRRRGRASTTSSPRRRRRTSSS